MHPIIFKLKFQNPRRFENLERSSHIYEDDTTINFNNKWCVVFSDEDGRSWIEKFADRADAIERQHSFINHTE